MTHSETTGKIALALAEQFGGEWRKAPGDNPWWVCDDGRLATTHRKVRLLACTMCGKYRAVMQCRRDVVGHFYIHQLACEAFHGPRPERCEVRHLDGDRLNNTASNLMWGTRAENHADKRRHGTSPNGERNPMAKLTPEVVQSMRELRRSCGLFYRDIAKRFGVSTMTAYRAVAMQSWK